MEEKDKVKIISKEMVEEVIDSLNKAEAAAPEKVDNNLDMNKVKEVISSFEGCTSHTIVGIFCSAFLLLPAGAIIAVVDMGEKVFKVKALKELKDRVEAELPDCECSKDAEASETPEE